jgi:error-prone DNA polymerase
MRYAELHCKTNFSFLEGASHADELVARGRELGYTALAVTDRNSLAGVVRAHIAAKEAGLKLLIGAELHPEDSPPLVVWATDRKAYGRLSRLLTIGRRRAEKGQCRLTLADIAQHAEGLIAGVGQGSGFGVQGSDEEVQSPRSKVQGLSTLDLGPRTLDLLRGAFGRGLYLLAELFRGPDDAAELARLVALSKETGLPLVAAGDVH